MYKFLMAAVVTTGLAAPGYVLAQTSDSTTAAAPAKTGTFSGGAMSNTGTAQAGAASKMVGTGTGSQVGNDTPTTKTTGSMSGTSQPAASTGPANPQ